MRKQQRVCVVGGGALIVISVFVVFPLLFTEFGPEPPFLWTMKSDLKFYVRPANHTTVLGGDMNCWPYFAVQPINFFTKQDDIYQASEGVPDPRYNQPSLAAAPVLSQPRPLKSNSKLSLSSSPKFMQSDPSSPFLLVVVCSFIENFQARRAIRETWGQDYAFIWVNQEMHRINFLPKTTLLTGNAVRQRRDTQLPSRHKDSSNSLSNIAWDKEAFPSDENFHESTYIDDEYRVFFRAPYETVRVLFMVGRSENETVEEKIAEESAMFGDMIQEDFLDTYNNLTLKSVLMLKWVLSNCQQAKYLMKTDDDTFVNTQQLVKYLKIHGGPQLLLGCIICNARPVKDRTSKWYTPRMLYDARIYPNYLSGTGYVLSQDLVRPIYLTALETPYFHIEDIYITGICAQKLQISPKDYEGFTYQRRKMNPCLFRQIVTGHRITPDEFYSIWQHINSRTLKCDAKYQGKLREYKPSRCFWR